MLNFKSKKLLVSLMAMSAVLLLLLFAFFRDGVRTIDLGTYNMLLKSNTISEAILKEHEILLITTSGTYSVIKEGVDLKELLAIVPVRNATQNKLMEDLIVLGLFFLMIVGLIVYGKKRKDIESKKEQEKIQTAYADPLYAPIIKASSSNYRFADVAGIQSVKEELLEIVDFLKSPAKYRNFGISLPRGVLLIGPPGVGKTLIAKAVAGEANVPFFYQSGASFVQIYVGMGAKRVRELFTYAKAHAPSIIFIDEIDAVGKARGGMRNDERESTLNQLLTQMDGFEDSSGVIVIAATNKIDVIDEALLRSGRFDRRIFIPMPDIDDREKILGIYLKGKPFRGEVQEIAKMSVGFSGAALETFVNEAAINALRENRDFIGIEDFVSVRSKVLLGKKKVLSFSDQEKRVQSEYQAAKALCAYWFEIEFEKISIVSDRLGDTDMEIESKTQMHSKIKVYLAGMVATKIKYGETFSNASDDLLRAREIATNMSQMYGMGRALVPYPDDVAHILDQASREVEEFLEGMSEPLEQIAQMLFTKESVTKAQLKEIVNAVF